jgi:hypothetical protein
MVGLRTAYSKEADMDFHLRIVDVRALKGMRWQAYATVGIVVVMAAASLCSCSGRVQQVALPPDLKTALQQDAAEGGICPAAVHGSTIRLFLPAGVRAVERLLPSYAVAASTSPNGTKCVIVDIEDQSRLSLLAIGNGLVVASLKARVHVWDGAVSDQGVIAATLSGDAGDEGALAIVSSGEQEPVVVAPKGRRPCFSGSGTELVYQEDGRITVYSISERVSRTVGLGVDPSWSPDGRFIAFRSADGYFHLVNSKGQNDRRLVRAEGIIGRLVWDPSSRYVLYFRRRLSPWEDLFDSAKCMEMRKLVVLRVWDGQTGTMSVDCGLSNPDEFAWIRSEALIRKASVSPGSAR